MFSIYIENHKRYILLDRCKVLATRARASAVERVAQAVTSVLCRAGRTSAVCCAVGTRCQLHGGRARGSLVEDLVAFTITWPVQ